MSIVTMLKGKSTARSPARDALAAAQNEMVGFSRELNKAQTVTARAQSLVDQAAERLEVASKAAWAAKSTHADAMLQAARTGEAVATSATHRELRHAETDAAADLDAARSALEIAEAARNDAQYHSNVIGRLVAERASAVIAEEVPRLREAVFARQRDLHAALAELSAAHACLPADGTPLWQSVRIHLSTTPIVYPDATGNISHHEPGERAWQAAKAPWTAAHDALLTNPDAPLPGAAT